MKSFKNRIVVAKADARDAWFSRGYLPHFDGERTSQHVCIGLFDALPATEAPRHILTANGGRGGGISLPPFQRLNEYSLSGRLLCPALSASFCQWQRLRALHGGKEQPNQNSDYRNDH